MNIHVNMKLAKVSSTYFILFLLLPLMSSWPVQTLLRSQRMSQDTPLQDTILHDADKLADAGQAV